MHAQRLLVLHISRRASTKMTRVGVCDRDQVLDSRYSYSNSKRDFDNGKAVFDEYLDFKPSRYHTQHIDLHVIECNLGGIRARDYGLVDTYNPGFLVCSGHSFRRPFQSKIDRQPTIL